jgi:hypothetical protein
MMPLAPEIAERIQTIESRLAVLDPILQGFCTQHDYRVSDMTGSIQPRRRVWRREEIDRCLDLTSDLTVPEAMERGFYPEMPWSLFANASLLPSVRPMRILSAAVFEGLPYSQLEAALENRLEAGLVMLQAVTVEDVIERGHNYGRVP